MREILKYLKPWSGLGGTCATVFGVEVHGRDRPKWHPVNLLYKVGSKWEDSVLYPLKYRFHPKHRYNIVHTRLKPGYHDQEKRMLYACFALLEEYVEELCVYHEEAQGLSAIDYLRLRIQELRQENAELGMNAEAQIAQEEEILGLYSWWTVTRPLNKEYHREWRKALYGGHARLVWNPVEFDGHIMYELTGLEGQDESYGNNHEYHDFGIQLDRDDQEMLHRLIDVRQCLWV